MWGCGEEGTDAGLGHWGLWQRSEYRAARRWRQLAQSYAIAPFWMMICSSFSRQCSLGVGGLGASSPSPFTRNIVKVAIEVSARARSPVVASMARRMTARPVRRRWARLGRPSQRQFRPSRTGPSQLLERCNRLRAADRDGKNDFGQIYRHGFPSFPTSQRERVHVQSAWTVRYI